MVAREFGSAYAHASRPVDDGRVSILSMSERQQSQYQPYHPDPRPKSSAESSTPERAQSWVVSPIGLQHALPAEQPTARPPPSPLPRMEPSLFGNRAVLDPPYQEPVAWANSTHFRSTIQEAPKPVVQGTDFVIREQNLSQDSRRYFRHPRHILEPWKAGFWVRFPWWGVGALLLILILTGASAGILLASHGMSIEDWRSGKDNAQPHVYISVFEMVMNFLILFALAEGVVIRFWRQLLHGTTLSTLHDTYESAHLWLALKRLARLRFNAVAIACVLAALSFVRGPLLQRALTLDQGARIDTQSTVDLQIAPYPIIQYFQSNSSDPRKQGGVTEAFSSLLKDLSASNPMPYDQPLNECGDYCTGTIKGFSFKTECASTTEPFDLSTLPEECKTCIPTSGSRCASTCLARQQNEFNPTFFSISYKQEDGVLLLNTIHKATSSCKGVVEVQTCRLTQVTSDYPVMITNGTIDRAADGPNAHVYDEGMPLDDRLMKKYWPLAFETLFPPLSVNVTPKADYSGLQYNKRVECRGVRDSEESNGSQFCSNSSSFNPGLFANDPSILYATENEPSSNEDPLCSLTWKDPMQDILTKMQSLAFRITVSMATTDPSIYAPKFTGKALADLRAHWTQSITVTGHRMRRTYRTSPLLVVLGVLISVLGIAAMMPLYNGFWELGRKVSLNPLEIARAFGAPILEGLDGNATPGMVTVERGGMSVRYGALERLGNEKRLRVEEVSRANVRVPWNGEIFG